MVRKTEVSYDDQVGKAWVTDHFECLAKDFALGSAMSLKVGG